MKRSRDAINVDDTLGIKSPSISGEYWEVDVPGDNSCLFWAAAMGFLLSAIDNQELFRQRYHLLFGNLENHENILKLLQNYNPFIQPSLFLDPQLYHLIRSVFRSRVIKYMKDRIEQFRPYHAEHQTFEQYLVTMNSPLEWGGELEILAISGMLGCNIHVDGMDAPQQYPAQFNEDRPILRLTHCQASEEAIKSGKNHYHFKITKEEGNEYVQRAEKQEQENFLADYHLFPNTPITISFFISSENIIFSTDEEYKFDNYIFEVTHYDDCPYNYRINIQIQSLPEKANNIYEITQFFKQTINSFKIQFSILGFTQHSNIKTNTNIILVNNILLPEIEAYRTYLQYFQQKQLSAAIDPSSPFAELYHLPDQFIEPVIHSILTYCQGLNSLLRGDTNAATEKFWMALEHLACSDDVHFPNEKRHNLDHRNRPGKVSDIGKHVEEFAVLYGDTSYDDEEQKTTFRELIGTIYKAYRCITVHTHNTTSPMMWIADQKGVDYVEGAKHKEFTKAEDDGSYIPGLEHHTLAPSLQWVERVIHGIITNFIKRHKLVNRQRDSFAIEYLIKRRSRSIFNLSENDVQAGEYITTDMVPGKKLKGEEPKPSSHRPVIPRSFHKQAELLGKSDSLKRGHREAFFQEPPPKQSKTDPHEELMNELLSLIGEKKEEYKNLISVLNKREYSRALRMICTSKHKITAYALASAMLNYRHQLHIDVLEKSGTESAIDISKRMNNVPLYNLLSRVTSHQPDLSESVQPNL